MKMTTAEVLTVTTGRMLCSVDRLYATLNFLTRDNLYTHQLGRALEEVRPWLCRWFPWSANVDTAGLDLALGGVEDADRMRACIEWVTHEAESRGWPASVSVEPILRDDHEVIDPLAELVSMTAAPIVIVLPAE